MTALLEQVITQAKNVPAAEQDAVAARLLQTLTEWARENRAALPKPRPQYGSARGLGHMTPDFDDPLEDLKDHTG